MKKSKVQFTIIAAVYISLFAMAAGAFYVYDRSQRFKNLQLRFLAEYVQLGAMIDPKTKTIILDSTYEHKPVAIVDVVALMALSNDYPIRFADCEITDESIAFMKQIRKEFGGDLQFQNCRVVRHQSAKTIIPIGNELIEPLPKHLAKGDPWPGTQLASSNP